MSELSEVQVLIPTYNRAKALGITLTSLYFQQEQGFDILIADQSESNALLEDASIQTVCRLLNNSGRNISILKNLPRKGMAQQRQFLLEHSSKPYSLFLDDDLVLDSYVIRNMKQLLKSEHCGFVGAAVIGLSYQNDQRPQQQHIEFWENGVQPETIVPKSEKWQRYLLHNAANLWHVQEKLNASAVDPRPYKVAWVGGCVMYNTAKLKQSGGFSFWKELPVSHCGEDVLAQLRVMDIYGGCGILPSGVYHQEVATTIPDREHNAPEMLFSKKV